MDVFLDTNVLLSLYKLSGPDLDELQKVIGLAKVGKLKVHISDQVCNEYWRNREIVIKQSLDQFIKAKGSQPIPNLINPYAKAQKLREALGVASDLVQELKDEADEDVRQNKLKADQVVEQLFARFQPEAVTPEIIGAARRRRDLGNPPGKASSLGDAVNWEWLLASVPQATDLHIVSADGDYESELHPSEPKEFLRREWAKTKKADVRLYRSLPDFLKEHFPDIKLADEIEKSFAIEKLEHAWTFQAAHEAIEGLDKYSEFSDSHLLRLINAYLENNQVNWILGDPDVRAFAEKLLGHAKSAALADAVAELRAMLELKDKKTAFQVAVAKGEKPLF